MQARTSWRRLLSGAALTGVLAGCAAGAAEPLRPVPVATGATPAETPSTTTAPSASASASAQASAPASPDRPTVPRVETPPPRPTPASFDVEAALNHVQRIAGLGPRDAVSRAHASAAAYVARELGARGYRVQLQSFRVPAGTSWGVKVPAGTSANVVAEPPGFDARAPHLVIGAHLDTVPQAPGAEDNASGVAVLLELARMLRQEPAGLPVRLVAFGAEESRGTGSSWYAFGSRHFVARLAAPERAAVRGMISLDRVGIRAATVPVCFGGRGTRELADALRAASPRVPTTACRNRASDHVSFEAAGIPAARIGSVPYPAYHSARDLPRLLDRRQLTRTGAVVWSWLRSIR